MIYYMISVVGLFFAAIWYIYTTEMRIAEKVSALDIKLKVLREDVTHLLSHIEYKKRNPEHKQASSKITFSNKEQEKQ